ncbi:MAG: hypothetical protein IH892_16220 [Planctomycetes bacterium]|nr:hypothetical protein [Planctomycetota bacterium]
MDHVSIPIPEGMDETQKAALTQWLSLKAAEATPDRLPCEDDPEWQAETSAQIKQGMEDVKAGRMITSAEARQRFAEKYGSAKPE